jgi:murein DD-endopeptidase MepM/ murein hydrolase activator NlpD
MRTAHSEAVPTRRSIREQAKTAPSQRRRANRKPAAARATRERQTRGVAHGARTRKRGAVIVVMLLVPGLTLPVSLPFMAPIAEAAIPTHARGKARVQTLVVADDASQQPLDRDGYSASSVIPRGFTPYVFTADTFTNDANSAVQWPFTVGVPISSRFGPRTPPCATCSAFHAGLDLTLGIGTPIQAMADGVVTVAISNDANYGAYVIIRHEIDGQMVESLYAHMLRNSIALRTGERVRVGQMVGLVGNTGRSTGPHLYFEIRTGGKPVDPLIWLPRRVRS